MEYAPILFALLIAVISICVLVIVIWIKVEPMQMIDISKVEARAKRDTIT